MKTEEMQRLCKQYRDGLLEDTVPFWFPRCVDQEYGGFFTALDREGRVIDTDKGIWQQGRISWLLATLYTTVEPRPEWLEWSRNGIEFLKKHGFDEDGRLFFQVTQDGRPLRKRRYVFSEAFASLAFAAYAKASGDQAAAEQSLHLFRNFLRYSSTPGLLPPKGNMKTRPVKGIAYPMITVNVAQQLRTLIGASEFCTEHINRCIAEIRHDFVHPELQCVLETVGPNGEFIDHFDGRTLNPGHAIEAAWFIMQEAKARGGDEELTALGCQMLDWMWERGWDRDYGGILYFVDVKGLPVQEYWHDMKFWWPHNEAIIATLLAYRLTGEEKYARRHRQVHEWAYAHFADTEHGDWYGYLHRDGRISVSLKGNLWKGPFHLPRMQWYCWRLLESMLEHNNDECSEGGQ